MFTMLFSCRTMYKVIIWYTPYQLMYGLHPLMPTKCITLVTRGDESHNTLMRILTSRTTKLEKL